MTVKVLGSSHVTRPPSWFYDLIVARSQDDNGIGSMRLSPRPMMVSRHIPPQIFEGCFEMTYSEMRIACFLRA